MGRTAGGGGKIKTQKPGFDDDKRRRKSSLQGKEKHSRVCFVLSCFILRYMA